MEEYLINMVFVVGNINGLLKIYHNETCYGGTSLDPSANSKLSLKQKNDKSPSINFK